MDAQTHTACIELGSHIGTREEHIAKAIQILKSNPAIQVQSVSHLIETDPVGGPLGQSRYLNGAAVLQTSLTPWDLLAVLLDIEQQLGRDRSSAERDLPRTLDLDLLLYDDVILDELGLQVPHPRLHQREFVLKPLEEIAPDYVHPILKKTIRELLSIP